MQGNYAYVRKKGGQTNQMKVVAEDATRNVILATNDGYGVFQLGYGRNYRHL